MAKASEEDNTAAPVEHGALWHLANIIGELNELEPLAELLRATDVSKIDTDDAVQAVLEILSEQFRHRLGRVRDSVDAAQDQIERACKIGERIVGEQPAAPAGGGQ